MSDMQVEVIPARSTFHPSAPVVVEVRSNTSDRIFGRLSVWRLGELVHAESFVGPGHHSIHGLPAGTYAVELDADGISARTAVEVTPTPHARLRYGFVASYGAAKDAQACADFARRLHLNAIQFYDWAYRHADLIGGGEEYQDALGQPISLPMVRELVDAYRSVGTASLGYAAVYAVGNDEWSKWRDHALLRPDGVPYSLGDFLRLVDPADETWMNHLCRDLETSRRDVGFDGFHLDQYGYPKRAVTPDGRSVDVAESFVTVIERIRDSLNDAFLVFNNVNDFPTWRTATTSMDAIYIEPWEPNTTLSALAATVSRARAVAAGRPVVLAAYQSVYREADPRDADRATAYTMATLLSHGATQLLCGEVERVLVDPYYVRNHTPDADSMRFLTRWHDFALEHDALLLDPDIRDVTSAYAGRYNGDLDVEYPGASVSMTPELGSVWRRITQTPVGVVLHLINLVGQPHLFWDASRPSPESPGLGQLAIRMSGKTPPIVRVADPDRGARLREVTVRVDGDFAVAELPEPHVWQVVHVDYQ